jgi:CheY-like chemotaxis protein
MTRGSILIVDDDPRLLHIVAMYLGIEGYDVTTAENGEDGLAQVEARAPDLVILDIMMQAHSRQRAHVGDPHRDVQRTLERRRHRARSPRWRQSPDHQAVQPCWPRVGGQDLLPSGRHLGPLSRRRQVRPAE